jgi:NAD(P)-dependent dehydrogenase (short-subunit alcohol dehydrogenase family)
MGLRDCTAMLKEGSTLKRFEGKGVVVTGAGRGIGRATAERFAAEGAGVVLLGPHADVLEETVGGIRAIGGRAEFVVGDVSSRDDVRRSVEISSEKFGQHDFMVANAGIAEFGPFLGGTDEAWIRQMGINLMGTWLSVQESARQMIQEGHGGAIVVVSSINAFQPDEEGVIYNASKSGQVAVMRTAAMELARYGIRVNGIAPGAVYTRLTSSVSNSPVEFKVFLDRTPMGRFAEPIEIARPILYLCSDDASFQTGDLMVVDGGYSVGMPVPGRAGEPPIGKPPTA